jgi:hypothetical protein
MLKCSCGNRISWIDDAVYGPVVHASRFATCKICGRRHRIRYQSVVHDLDGAVTGARAKARPYKSNTISRPYHQKTIKVQRIFKKDSSVHKYARVRTSI